MLLRLTYQLAGWPSHYESALLSDSSESPRPSMHVLHRWHSHPLNSPEEWQWSRTIALCVPPQHSHAVAGTVCIFFQIVMLASLYQPALIALALPIDFCKGAARDPEFSLRSAGGAEHVGFFLLGGDEVFGCFAAPLYSTSMQWPSGPLPRPTTRCRMVKNL